MCTNFVVLTYQTKTLENSNVLNYSYFKTDSNITQVQRGTGQSTFATD